MITSCKQNSVKWGKIEPQHFLWVGFFGFLEMLTNLRWQMKKDYRPLLINMLSLEIKHQVEHNKMPMYMLWLNFIIYLLYLLIYKGKVRRKHAWAFRTLGCNLEAQSSRPPLTTSCIKYSSLEFKSSATLVK